MNISVTQPIGRAYERMKMMLFRPFKAGKWFRLGFCVWLSMLGQGGGNFNCSGNWTNVFSPPAPPAPPPPPAPAPRIFPPAASGTASETTPEVAPDIAPDVAPPATTPSVPMPTGSPATVPPGWPPGAPAPDIGKMLDWLNNNWWLAVGIGVGSLVLVILLSLLLIWLSNRGRFMVLDGLVYNRGDVKKPWSEFAALADSACAFEFTLGLICLAIVLAAAGASLSLAWSDIEAQQFSSGATWGLIVLLTTVLPVSLVSLVLQLLLRDFVIPTMYLRRVRVREAWSIVRWEVLAGRAGRIILFYLMRFVIVMISAVIAMLATCATCCMTAVPYLGVVILLPIFVFDRCYVLYVLEQFGPAWTFFGLFERSRFCQSCSYDLTGNVSAVCPECGQSIPDWQRELLREQGLTTDATF